MAVLLMALAPAIVLAYACLGPESSNVIQRFEDTLGRLE